MLYEVITVEAEGLAAVVEIGLGDGALGLDRVHEAQGHIGAERCADKAHLGDRGDVVMRDAIGPHDRQQVGRRIGLSYNFV